MSLCGSDAVSGAHRVAGASGVNRTDGACAVDTVLGHDTVRYGAEARVPARPGTERFGRVWPLHPRPQRGSAPITGSSKNGRN